MNKQSSFMIQIAHWLMYLPVAVLYFVFEVAKAILTELEKVAVAVFVLMLILETVIMSSVFMTPFNFIRMAFSKGLWTMFMKDFLSINYLTSAESVMLRIFLISLYLVLFIGIPLFISSVIYFASEELDKRIKWEDIEYEFRVVFETLSDRTEIETRYNRSSFYMRSVVSVALNIILITLLVTLVGFASKGIRALDSSDHARKSEVENETGYDRTGFDDDTQEYISVGVDVANIRSGPGKEYDRIQVSSRGESFLITGNTKTDKSGYVWYEIYLSEDTKKTGWMRDSVLE